MPPMSAQIEHQNDDNDEQEKSILETCYNPFEPLINSTNSKNEKSNKSTTPSSSNNCSDGWFESLISNSLDVLSIPCDVNVNQSASILSGGGAIDNKFLTKHDYAKLHDEFLEALLYEQILKLFEQRHNQSQQRHNNNNSLTLATANNMRLNLGGHSSGDLMIDDDERSSFTFNSRISQGSSGGSSSLYSFLKRSNHSFNRSNSTISASSKRKATVGGNYSILLTSSSSSLTEDDGILSKGKRTPSGLRSSKKNVSFKASPTSGTIHNKSRKVTPISSPGNGSSFSPPVEDTNTDRKSKGDKEKNIRLAMKGLQLSKKSYPEISTYMRNDCKLQKDRGEGSEPGSMVVASNLNECLDKLNQKMELVVQMVVPCDINNSSSSSANNGIGSNVMGGKLAAMKRRHAYVSDIEIKNNLSSSSASSSTSYVETRSKLELRLGFMSMQYGILARWDISKTGKIILVVLRKMCTDAFYNKTNVPRHVRELLNHQQEEMNLPPPQLLSIQRSFKRSKSQLSNAGSNRNISNNNKQITTTTTNTRSNNSSSSAIRSSTNNTLSSSQHAILQRPSGTEVTLLQPPYLISRPKVFDPARIIAQVHCVNGIATTETKSSLSSSTTSATSPLNSTWTLVLSLDKENFPTYSLKLDYNKEKQCYYCTGPYEWKLPIDEGFSSASASCHKNGVESHQLDIELWEEQSTPAATHDEGSSSPVKTKKAASTTTTSPSPRKLGFSHKRRNSSDSLASSISKKIGKKIGNSGSSKKKSTATKDKKILRLKSSIPLTFFDVSSKISERIQVSCRDNRENDQPSNTSANRNRLNDKNKANTTGNNNNSKRRSNTNIENNGNNYEVVLNLYHQSDYSYWLYQEIEARRNCNENGSNMSCGSSLSTKTIKSGQEQSSSSRNNIVDDGDWIYFSGSKSDSNLYELWHYLCCMC